MRWHFLAAVLLLVVAGRGGAGAEPADVPLRIVEAGFALGDASGVPPPAPAWRRVRLDQRQDHATAGAAGSAWYRLRVPAGALPPSAGRQAVYIASIHRDIELRVDGRVVASAAMHAQRRRVVCCTAFLELPDGALSAAGGEVDLRMSLPARSTVWLAPVYVGDAGVLWTRYERRLLLGGIGRLVAMALAVAVAAVCLLLWLRRRGEAQVLLFGLAAAGYAIASAQETWIGPLGTWSPVADVTNVMADFGSAAAMLVFMLRHGGWRWPAVERGLLVWVLVSAALQPLVDFYDPASTWRAWWHTGTLVYVATLPVAAAIAWRRPCVQSFLLLAGAALSASLVATQLVSAVAAESAYLWPYHPLGLFAVIAWMLVDRLVLALRHSERLNVELERRVADKTAEVERNAVRLRELASEAAVAAERQRIMGDMHDGIGAALISTLSLVEGGSARHADVATALRECIDDLRLAIDSLEPADGDLAPVLGGLRYRLEPRLRAQGITLDWQVQDLPTLAYLTPQKVLHVLRILQEAFTNVLKHAQARRIRVATAVDAGRVSIEVSDDGRGFDGAPSARGHGLANMRNRAKAIGGDLRIQPSAAGTTLSLSLPIG
jgi:signal transduction histidine kinase